MSLHKYRQVCLLTLLVFSMTVAGEDGTEKEESAIRLVPLLTSTPLTGTGVGAVVSYLYSLDEQSSKSQLQVGGQYSNTDSVTLFVRNNAFLNGNSTISNTAFLPAKTNSEFSGEDGADVKYRIDSLVFNQKLLFEIRDKLYLGGKVLYKNLDYSGNNAAGDDFLYDNGIVDEQSGGVGVAGSFDTRSNKYYPSDAYWFDLDLDTFPTALGAQNSYSTATINARYYKAGFAPGDVWASQFYGQYSSTKTPDSGLATLSGKSVLRGFPAGQFKARFLNGVQTEYRYQLVDTLFRLVAFAGAAQLSGGSYGEGDRHRDDDGMYYAGGVGLRYAIQSRTGVDLRLDFVTTSENEESVYLTLNQAF